MAYRSNSPVTPTRRQAVAYARASRGKEQEREGFSIPSQLKLLRAHAQACDIELVREFVDVETAKEPGRANFSEMLSFLKRQRACRLLLVEKTDRLYRNLKDWVSIDTWIWRSTSSRRTWSSRPTHAPLRSSCTASAC